MMGVMNSGEAWYQDYTINHFIIMSIVIDIKGNTYSKTGVKQLLKNRQNKDLINNW